MDSKLWRTSTRSSPSDISSDASAANTFRQVSVPYVATIEKAYVEGENGLVWDVEGNIYHENMFFGRTTTMPTEVTANRIFEAHQGRSNTPRGHDHQRYGHMYYHFVVEPCPSSCCSRRPACLRAPRSLMWGEPSSRSSGRARNFASRRKVRPQGPTPPTSSYFPTPAEDHPPAPRVPGHQADSAPASATRGREDRHRVLHPRPRVSRRSPAREEHTRQASGPPSTTSRGVRPSTTCQTRGSPLQRSQGDHGTPRRWPFPHALRRAWDRRARVPVHEDPPMMFWHLAAALDQDYWLLPVPSAWWMQEEMTIPVEEVVDMVTPCCGRWPWPAPGSEAAPPARYTGVPRRHVRVQQELALFASPAAREGSPLRRQRCLPHLPN